MKTQTPTTETETRSDDSEQFLSKVTSVWDETTVVSGNPTEEATLARCDGEQWRIRCSSVAISIRGRKTESQHTAFLRSEDGCRPHLGRLAGARRAQFHRSATLGWVSEGAALLVPSDLR